MKSILSMISTHAVTITSTDVFVAVSLLLFMLAEVFILLWAFKKLPDPGKWFVKSTQKITGQLRRI